MSAEQYSSETDPAYQPPFFVTVAGFEYKVLYAPEIHGGIVSHFEFRHWKDGAVSEEPSPLTSTGYRSHFFTPSIMEGYDCAETGAIAAIESQQDLKKWARDEAERKEAARAAAQMSLF